MKDTGVYLQNYYRLIERVDRHCEGIQQQYGRLMQCRKGCSTCCSHISVFPVEAAVMMDAIMRLPKTVLADLGKPDGIQSVACPLLSENKCLIYPARPLICRTHGLPLLTVESDNPIISCCPQNFQNMSPIPSQAMIDLESLNQILIAINTVFLKEWSEKSWPTDRIQIAKIIQRARSSFEK